MAMPGSLFSPATEGFRSPTAAQHPTASSDGAAGDLKPSLSRKSSRPSSLALAHAAQSSDWNPDLVLDTANSPADLRVPAGKGLPPATDPSDPSPSSRPASSLSPETARATKLEHGLKSPCFVHSNLDKGASFADWLRDKQHREGIRGPGMSRPDEPDRDRSGGLHSAPSRNHSLQYTTGSSSSDSSGFASSPEMDDEEEEYGGSLTRQLAETAVGVREMSKQLGRARIHSNIQSILIVTKAKDNRLIKLTRELALYLMLKKRRGQDRGLVVYVDTQLRTSRRFDAAGMEREHPELFEAMPRRRSSSSNSLASMSSSSSLAGTSDPSKEQGQLRYWTADMCSRSPHLFDFVITLGGDGTVLFTSWLFQRIVPPVLPFALGSLGFLTNFDFADHQSVMDSVLESGIRVNLRMRFTCTVYRAVIQSEDGGRKVRAVKKAQTGEIMMKDIERGGWEALEGGYGQEGPCGSKDKEIMCFTTRPVESFEVINDLVVDRGPSPYVSLLELFADDHHLTTVQADGLCISTPTGSTAYSMSAGGSLVHPEIPALLVTPLCPHTLSFRPMLLPDSMELRICVPYNSRSTAWISFDGRGRVELKQGDHIKVTASQYPFPTVCVDRASTDWFHSVSRTLKWNERERQKSFVVVEENPSRRSKKKSPLSKETGPASEPATVPEVEEEGENEEGEDEEDDGKFDIDDLSSADTAEDAKSSIEKSLLNPEERAVGQDKAREVANGQGNGSTNTDEAALAAARAIAEGNPLIHQTAHHTSGVHSGIDTPDRFMGPHPHPPRHVNFAGAGGGDWHAPRAVYPGDQRGVFNPETDRDMKTPTAAEVRRGQPLHAHAHLQAHAQSHPHHSGGRRHTRTRSAEVGYNHGHHSHHAHHGHGEHRAFAVWGQDESESESNASDSDAY